MTDIITNPEPTAPAVPSPESTGATVQAFDPIQPAQAAEAIPAPESLSGKYARLAEEFRGLTQKQFEMGLNPGETVRKRELDDMAGYGLFVKGQIESLLTAKERIYLDHRNLMSQELANPEELAREFRDLNRKSLSSEGLKPDEIERLMHLRPLANSGAFENLDKAA